MDEMAAVRRFRDDAPVPDGAQLAEGHRRLQAEIARARPKKRLSWQYAAVGAVSAVAATALLSASLLSREATTAKAPESRARHWVYQKVRWDSLQCGAGPAMDGYSEVGLFNLGPASRTCRTQTAAPQYRDKWIRYDGQALATPDESTSDPDDVDVWKGDYQAGWEMLAPADSDDLVRHLPAGDPTGALRLIRSRFVPTRFAGTLRLTQAERDFIEVVGVLSTTPDVPADKARTLYEVIVHLPGATEPVAVTDGAGRAAVAIGVEAASHDNSDQRNRMQVLLDPDTHGYLGVRYVAGIDYYVGGRALAGPFVPKGTVVATATRVRTAVVHEAGERRSRE